MIEPNIVKVPFRKLKHIHHISDIQIRNLKRHKEYEEVFERTYEEVRKNKDNAVAYIGGDIAHSKTDMSPELIDQLSRLFKNLADIFNQGLTIGANFGSYYGEEFEQYKKSHKKQIEYTSATSKRFEMLNKQRIDYAIEDELVGNYLSKRGNSLMKAPTIPAINKDQIHLMLSKRTVTPDEVKIINVHIAKNKAALKALFE